VIDRILADTFRCPEELGLFNVTSTLSSDCGYFHFGEDTICYGRSLGVAGKSPTRCSYDALGDVRIDGSSVILPFSPSEVIDNLRLERYVDREPKAFDNYLSSAYYLVRPLMPVWLRRHFQRLRLRGSRGIAFPQWPVDYTVERILNKLLAVALRVHGGESIPFIWFWPYGFPSCAIITHDVETSEGLEFCPALMEIDDSFGIKSSFQLVPEERYSVSERLLNLIRHQGFEVNVHDLNHDGRLYRDRDEFLRRAQKINQYAHDFGAQGFRSGAMYRNLNWYDAFKFNYDMSVPNAGHLEAQPGGSCTVRPYFINGLVELPLTTTQDYSLFHILGDYSIDVWKQQIHTLLENHGLISFIVHPDYIIDKKAQNTYKSLLAYLAQLQVEGKLWIARPGDVASWWRERYNMRCESSGNKWRILGAGQERACLAKAYLAAGKVCYETDLCYQPTGRRIASLA
jgi:hypothetical protein